MTRLDLYLGALLAIGCGGAPQAANRTPTAAPGTSPAPAPAAGQHTHGAHHAHGYAMDFSDVQRFARHFDGPDRAAWQRPEEVVALLELAPGHVVADIGAGTGYFTQHLSMAVGSEGRVLALDVEPNMVAYIAERAQKQGWANVEARTVAPADPGLGSSSVDRVLIVNTWHHMSDRAAYSSTLGRALRPGGAILIVDFTLEAEHGPPREHRLSAEQVIAELRAGGLMAELVKAENLPQQYVVRAKRIAD